VRVAFAQMRRRKWHEVSLEEAILRHKESENITTDPLDDPERAAAQRVIMGQFRCFIDEELTERQRGALLAALGEMPLEEIAQRMDTNRNALDKLLHGIHHPFAS
jgi:RNA polymerase sigma-70 factor (ECF subfamily)